MARSSTRPTRLSATLAALALALGALGVLAGAGASGAGAQAPPLVRIYSSLPLRGAAAAQSRDIVAAIRLALKESGGLVAGARVEYTSLDDSTRATRNWGRGRTAANARRAARDEHTLAYIGEFNSDATAVSLPILNKAGILQVSPSNTYAGLTRREGAARGDPQRYYQTGRRTYGRVIPTDLAQAAAIVRYLQELRVRRAFLVDDGGLYGSGLADMVARRLASRRITQTGRRHLPLRYDERRWAAIARAATRSGAGAMVFGGIIPSHAVELFRAVAGADPDIKLIGPDGVFDEAFTRRLPRSVARRTYITNPTLAPAAYPPAAQRFYTSFRADYGHDPEPYAIYGYEAMRVILDSITGGGRLDRDAARSAFFATRDRNSVLGTYSIDPSGDTTLSTYGAYRIARNGRLRFDHVLDSTLP